jgi:hypothetical protein
VKAHPEVPFGQTRFAVLPGLVAAFNPFDKRPNRQGAAGYPACKEIERSLALRGNDKKKWPAINAKPT